MDRRTAITIRFPPELLNNVKQALSDGESINSFVLEAVERAVRRRQGLQAHERIVAMSARIEAATGKQPSSTELIRELRDGSGRLA